MIRVVSVPLLYRVREGLALKRAPPPGSQKHAPGKGLAGEGVYRGGSEQPSGPR